MAPAQAPNNKPAKKRNRIRRQRALPQKLRDCNMPPGSIQNGVVLDGERVPHIPAASSSRRRRKSISPDHSSGRDSVSSRLSTESELVDRPSSTPLPSRVVDDCDVDPLFYARPGSAHVGEWAVQPLVLEHRVTNSFASYPPVPQELELTGAGFNFTEFSLNRHTLLGGERTRNSEYFRGHELQTLTPGLAMGTPYVECGNCCSDAPGGQQNTLNSVNQMESFGYPLPPFPPTSLFCVSMANSSNPSQSLQHLSGLYPSPSHEALAYTSAGASSFDPVGGVDRMSLGVHQMHVELPYFPYNTSSDLLPQGMVPHPSIQGSPNGMGRGNSMFEYPDFLEAPSPDPRMRHDAHTFHSN